MRAAARAVGYRQAGQFARAFRAERGHLAHSSATPPALTGAPRYRERQPDGFARRQRLKDDDPTDHHGLLAVPAPRPPRPAALTGAPE